MKRKSALVMLLISMFVVAGCMNNPHTTSNTRIGQAQEFYVEYGRIEKIIPIKVSSDTGKTVGAVGGAVVGGVLGSMIGGGRGSTLASVGGAALGGLAGAAAGDVVGGHSALEIVVTTDSGRTISIIEDTNAPFSVGQRVRLMVGGQNSKIEAL